jgi:hypothetical protein
MTPETPNSRSREPDDGTDLWRVVMPLIIWAVHFTFCYGFAAIACEKAGRATGLGEVRAVVLVASVVGLALILREAVGLMRVRGRSLTDNDFDFEHDTPEERHRFLSHMALMLCVLSAVGIIYVTIPVLLVPSCR